MSNTIDEKCYTRSIIFDNLSNLCLVVNNANDIIDINLPAKLFFDITDNKIVGQQFNEIFIKYPEINSFLFENNNKKEISILKTEKCFYFEIIKNLLRNQDKESVGKILIMSDITEQKNSEILLRELNEKIQKQNNDLVIRQQEMEGLNDIFFATNLELEVKTEEVSRQNKEITQINAVLNQQKEEIQAQAEYLEAANQEMSAQKDEIERNHSNITDSIVYAKRIQKAVLPNFENVSMYLADHFIFFKPRNIVSGDFYFVKQINDYLIVAAADCTGHGVPGAFMSMLGITLLNEIVRRIEINTAAQVLEELRIQVKNALQQTGQRHEQQDGMDIAFVAINCNTFEMSFAGAYNPVLIFPKKEQNSNTNEFKFIELQGDRQPVGIHLKEKPFTEHRFQLQAGDTLYLFSDGYQSQFGGDNKEKFKARRFKELLKQNVSLPMIVQKEILEYNFTQWQAANAQTDDVLVIGVRI